MTRILHVSKTATGGRFIGLQLRALSEMGLDVQLAAPGPGALTRMATDAGVPVHVIPELGKCPGSAVAAFADLTNLINPDIVHAHFVNSVLTARAARFVARRAHAIFFQVPGPLHLERRWSRHLEIATAGKRDHWGPACQWSLDRYLRSGIQADRLHLSYYGKDLTEFDVKNVPSVDRGTLGLRRDEYLAVMVSHIYPPRRGRLRGIKGHEDFIDAIAHVQRERPNVTGLIVGKAWQGAERYSHRLRERARSRGASIRFVGHRDDVTAIYRTADLAVHPSLSENLGGAVESLLMEVPTVTTDVGGFKDIVRHGETGLMVRPRCPEELANAIVWAMDNDTQMRNMARIGRARVVEIGNADVNARKIAHVYTQLV